MCFSCKPTSRLCFVCGTDHVSIRDIAQTPVISHRSLSAMPGEILHRLIRFNPDSALIFLVASRAFNQTARAFLQWNTQHIVTQCQNSNLPLYRNIYRNFIRFSLSFPPNVARLALSIPETIRSFGISGEACPNTILSIGAIQQFDPGIQTIQDSNLQIIWDPVHDAIIAANPLPAGIPAPNASAREIRTWMQANLPVLQGILNLGLHHLNLTSVPTEIGLFTGLQKLGVINNQMGSLPAGIFGGLESLQELSLGCNQLRSLPAGIFCRLESLQGLSLFNNKLRSLPAGLFYGLKSLNSLTLDYNQLCSLPAGLFGGLGSLQKLHLDCNKLCSLPAGIFDGLGSLQELYLGYNQLRSLPAGIFDGLESLRLLSISFNQLHSLPARLFWGLKSLEALSISCNQLHSLPPEIFDGLESLQLLYLFANPLLVFYKDLSEGNNIALRGVTREFFNYACKTPFAAFYQFAAGSNSPEAVREAFAGLDVRVKNAILRCVWEEAGCPANDDSHWGENHAFDDMQIFYGALKRYVSESFEELSPDDKNAVYGQVYHLAKDEGIDVDAARDPQWGEHHAGENILRLIDAMHRRIG